MIFVSKNENIVSNASGGLLFHKIFGQNAELFKKAFGEIGGRSETHNKCNLIHAVFFLTQQLGRFFKSDKPYEVVGR